jgi:ABC-type nitrate/sulfonate/bicarbonate transport system ATPase subunit
MFEPAKMRPASGLPLLSIHGLDKVFAHQDGTTDALRNIGFDIATRGTVAIYGTEVDGPGPDRGMVFQDYALFPWLTVRENIGFGPRHTGMSSKQVAEITDRFLSMVGLTQFADRYPHQLSGGMKQRVAIARVLANDTDLLLMDEPFGALDALTRTKLQEELVEIWQRTGLTVIFVTHSVEEATLLADRVLVMSAAPGRIDCTIDVDLPRPRDVSSSEFNALRRDITRRLTSHIAPAGPRDVVADA